MTFRWLDHDSAVAFARGWGLLYLFLIFVGAVIWTYWPSRKAHFKRGERLPLGEGKSLPEDLAASTTKRAEGVGQNGDRA